MRERNGSPQEFDPPRESFQRDNFIRRVRPASLSLGRKELSFLFFATSLGEAGR